MAIDIITEPTEMVKNIECCCNNNSIYRAGYFFYIFTFGNVDIFKVFTPSFTWGFVTEGRKCCSNTKATY